jgi:flagellar hook protein FlgE
MFTSFNTALSALSADTTAIDVVGNNLANLNTPGYKASVVSFSDLVTESLGAGLGATQVGFGVAAPITIRQFSQGAIQSSSGTLDVAIQGDGFLVVKDPTSNGGTLYTRGGNLEVNKAGQLVTATGFQVQGWNAVNGVLDTTTPPTSLSVQVGSLTAPKPTANISFDLNLDAGAVSTPTPTTFSTSITAYDSLGGSHAVSVQFTKNATAGQWDYTMTFPAADMASGTAATQTGTVAFDTNGNLTSPPVVPSPPTPPTNPPTLAVSGLANGASDMSITWNLYNSSGQPRLTMYSQTSAVSANAQDGAPAAQLTHIGVADGGQIIAKYSNGAQIAVGQLAMVSIVNPESLIATGSNYYQLSSKSALPAIGLPSSGGRGQILGGSVESSTVDIAKEFTNLIVYQRAYEANSKVITTTDQLSQSTIGLIR